MTTALLLKRIFEILGENWLENLLNRVLINIAKKPQFIIFYAVVTAIIVVVIEIYLSTYIGELFINLIVQDIKYRLQIRLRECNHKKRRSCQHHD